MTNEDPIRIDQWLWASRFFKTRALAKVAVESGKIEINGTRPKPSRAVRLNDELIIDRQGEIFTVRVLSLVAKRVGAEKISELYFEEENSKKRREDERQLRQLARLAQPQTEGRPTKKQRRQLHQFKNLSL